MITLNNLLLNQRGIVKKVTNEGSIKRRLLDIGLIENAKVEAILQSPGKDMKAYKIRGSLIAIRNEDAKKIYVEVIK